MSRFVALVNPDGSCTPKRHGLSACYSPPLRQKYVHELLSSQWPHQESMGLQTQLKAALFERSLPELLLSQILSRAKGQESQREKRARIVIRNVSALATSINILKGSGGRTSVSSAEWIDDSSETADHDWSRKCWGSYRWSLQQRL